MYRILAICLVLSLTGCATLRQENWKSKAKAEQKQAVEFCGNIPLSGIDAYPHLFYMAFLYGLPTIWEKETNNCVNDVNKTFAQSNSYEEWNTNIKEVIARYTRVWGLLRGISFNVSGTVLHKEKFEERKDEIISLLVQSTNYIHKGSRQADDKTVSEFIKHLKQIIADTILKEAEFLKNIGVY